MYVIPHWSFMVYWCLAMSVVVVGVFSLRAVSFFVLGCASASLVVSLVVFVSLVALGVFVLLVLRDIRGWVSEIRSIVRRLVGRLRCFARLCRRWAL